MSKSLSAAARNEAAVMLSQETQRTGQENKSYTLATGEGAAERLELLQRVYGPATLRLLETAGVKRGVCVADLGCGVGTVTEVLSEL